MRGSEHDVEKCLSYARFCAALCVQAGGHQRVSNQRVHGGYHLPPDLCFSREHAKLDTVAQINDELRRTYRLFVNKQITHAEMSRRRELLVALRAGFPDPIEQPKATLGGGGGHRR